MKKLETFFIVENIQMFKISHKNSVVDFNSEFLFYKNSLIYCPHFSKLLNTGETRHSRKSKLSAMPSLIGRFMNQEDAILEIFNKANEYIPVFQAMADSERLFILLKLFYAGLRGKNVTELSEKTRLSRPAISHHIKVLKAAKIIESRKEGTQIYYTLNSREKLSFVEDLLKKLYERLEVIDANFEELNDEIVTRIISRAQTLLQ